VDGPRSVIGLFPLLFMTAARGEEACLRFVGDMMLGRGVADEARARGLNPWAGAPQGDVWVGNLEGGLRGGGACDEGDRVCIGVEPETLGWLSQPPFVAVSLANNHSHDFGEAGYAATRAALAQGGVQALTEEEGPVFLDVAGRRWAFVVVNTVDRPGLELALERTRVALLRARAETPWVVVMPHWGIEGARGYAPGQERWTERFFAWGATFVIGSHAHVVQPSRCTAAGADWTGLGNHLFDQRLPQTWVGESLRCCPDGEAVVCAPERTERSAHSTFPVFQGPSGPACRVEPPPVDRRWEAHVWRDHFLTVEPLPAAGPDAFFALHPHYSDIDGQNDLRPYVFQATEAGFVDLWRGSALSRPIVAGKVIEVGGQSFLCVIHRGDSFLRPDPATPLRTRKVYRWSGFGFSGVDDPAAVEACAAL
jgi:poly-gamma-glutamate capsule biosynthesis protein CapA/YwtB (metallophosphatase superfamily)